MKRAIPIFLVFLACTPCIQCRASRTPNLSNPLRRVLRSAAKRVGVKPVAIMEVLATVESRMNPYAIHLSARYPLGAALRAAKIPFTAYTSGDRYHYVVTPKNYTQAAGILEWAQTTTVWYDVGLLQIFRGNVERYKLNPVALLNPRNNAIVGSYIFKQCSDRYPGNFWAAIECYHRGAYHGYLTPYASRVRGQIVRLLKAWVKENG